MPYKMLIEEARIFDKTELIFYLYECLSQKKKIELSFMPEGPSAEACGLYSLLDKFCMETGYIKSNITIVTGNMLEHHDSYNIIKSTGGWYEIKIIQEWVQNNRWEITYQPRYHFGSFVGLSRWPRLWLASWLYHHHKEKTLQTFHSSFACNYRTNKNDGIYDDLGLDLLNQYDCDNFSEVVEFLKQCPIVLTEDLEQTKNIKIPEGYPAAEQTSLYPLQVPANLNIVYQYNNIFADIIVEPNVIGDCFLSTEKIWRCIIARRPFIVMSNNNHLHNMQKLGFKTFNKWFNEDYDYYIAQDRIKHIQSTVNTISNWRTQELAEKLQDMYTVLDYNFQHFMNISRKDFQQHFGAQ